MPVSCFDIKLSSYLAWLGLIIFSPFQVVPGSGHLFKEMCTKNGNPLMFTCIKVSILLNEMTLLH